MRTDIDPASAADEPAFPWWTSADPSRTQQLPPLGPADRYQPLPPAPPAASDQRRPWRRWVATGAAASVLAVASGATGAALVDDGSGADTAAVTTVADDGPAGDADNTADTSSLAGVAATVQPSVVSIQVRGGGQAGEGSGVVMNTEGAILTNNHVVEAAADGGSVRVRFANGRTADATIVGRSPATDLAVLDVDGVTGLTPATFGTDASIEVGETALAIGSPLGLEGSVTAGIVSALHRQVGLGGGQGPSGQASLDDAIQTDAAINPGNSGGPLVDGNGHVIGITSAIATLGSTGQSGNIGLGFAIPVDRARQVAETLARGERPQVAVLGVQMGDNEDGGALLASVTRGSAAGKAGLRAGDVITRFGDREIETSSDLPAAVRSQQPGDEVTVRYQRNGETRTARVTLGAAAG